MLARSLLSIKAATVASPVMLTAVRGISSIRSIPAIKAEPSRGRPRVVRIMVSMMKPAPGTPAVPIEARVPVRMIVRY